MVACGDDLQQESSGGPQASPTQLSADKGPANRAPEITGIRFEPADAIPGKLLRARVDATDPDRNPIDLGYTWTINGRRAPAINS